MSNPSSAPEPKPNDHLSTANAAPSTSTTTAQTDTMPPPLPRSPSHPLTLILAATPTLGIGKNGALPWPMLKSEMAYFARVTKRVPPRASTSSPHIGEERKRRINAVVMGRKTWDSIPEKFRPLKDRLNIVITRQPDAPHLRDIPRNEVEGPAFAPSVSAALEASQVLHPDHPANEKLVNWNTGVEVDVDIERVFVIGGASIYAQALELPECERVLLTRIEKEFECDTFFPLDLEKDGRWRKSGKRELEEWVGEEVEGVVQEKGVRFGFEMWEREREGEGRVER